MAVDIVEKNLIRTVVPTTGGVIYTASVKIAIKHIVTVNNNDNTHSKVTLSIGPTGAALPFLPTIKLEKNGFFQWEGWDVLEVNDIIEMSSEKPNVYVHISGAEL